jgi:hypothetical protein
MPEAIVAFAQCDKGERGIAEHAGLESPACVVLRHYRRDVESIAPNVFSKPPLSIRR